MNWENIPPLLLEQLGQLTKANSIQANKLKNVQIIYTPWSNVKKKGDMDTGTVMFHNDRRVKRFLVKERDNAVVNALNKTKREVQVDHEMVRQERERNKGREKKAKAIEESNSRLELERAREAERKARDYSSIYSSEAIERSKREKEIEVERARRAKEERGEKSGSAQNQEKEGGSGDDDDDDNSSVGSFM